MENKAIKKRESELDALRGIAALSVVLFHYYPLSSWNLTAFRAGGTGVDLFFLISGYVIFMTLNKTKAGGEFVISRLSRLFPTYFVMMAVTLLCLLIFKMPEFPSLQVIGGNLTMLQPIFKVPNIDEVYWTLTVELEFYMLMLVLFYAKALNKIQYVGIVLVVVFQLYHYIAVNYFATSAVYILPRSYFPIINHFQAFFAGILFYKIKNEGATWLRHLMIFLCYLGTMALFKDSGKAHYFISFPVYAVLLTFYYIVFYLFVYGRLGFIAVAPLLVLGQISYSLYLVHGEAGKMLHPFLCNTLGMNGEFAIIVILCVMILISYIVTFYIEQPVIAYIRNRFLKRPVVSIKKPVEQYATGKVRYSEQDPVCK